MLALACKVRRVKMSENTFLYYNKLIYYLPLIGSYRCDITPLKLRNGSCPEVGYETVLILKDARPSDYLKIFFLKCIVS